MRPEPLRVLLLGDDPLARSALAALLAHDAELILVGQGGPREGASLARDLDPDVILWDMGWAPAFDDDDSQVPLGLDAPLLALVAGEARAAEARVSGARGVVRRDTQEPRLFAALHAVAQGLSVFDEAATAALLRPRAREPREPIEPLTPREQEVLQLLSAGRSNKQIAQQLSISEHTAKFHVARLVQKLGAETRSEAVFIGARLGLLLL